MPATSYNELRKSFHGQVITPDHADYDRHRRVWNLDVDRRPAAVARCADEHDVQLAVRFAANVGITEVAVRGAGHSYPGLSTCDDGLVIDLSAMRAGRVGDDHRILVEGGAQLGDMDRLTATVGTAVPAGVEATTGVAGLTLGGGVGALQRRFGLTCDNLRAVRMVTPTGEVVCADDESDPELMWGLRGGGGNFGIVTEFELQSHPVGTLTSNFLVFPIDRLAEFGAFFNEYVVDLPRDMSSCGVLPKLAAGAGPRLRGVGTAATPSSQLQDAEGDHFAVTALWVGEPTEVDDVLKPLLDWKPVAHIARPVTHLEMQSARPEFGVPQNRYVRGGYLDDVGAGALLDCAAMVTEFSPPVSEFVFATLGGAVAEVGEDDTAFTGRSAKYLYAIEASWSDPSERESTIAWVREAHDAVERHARGGAYTNIMTDEGSVDVAGVGGIPPREEQVRRTYGAGKYKRLQNLKAAWDPTNLFHLNVNITPATAEPLR